MTKKELKKLLCYDLMLEDFDSQVAFELSDKIINILYNEGSNSITAKNLNDLGIVLIYVSNQLKHK
jgi:hypothetical protein